MHFLSLFFLFLLFMPCFASCMQDGTSWDCIGFGGKSLDFRSLGCMGGFLLCFLGLFWVGWGIAASFVCYLIWACLCIGGTSFPFGPFTRLVWLGVGQFTLICYLILVSPKDSDHFAFLWCLTQFQHPFIEQIVSFHHHLLHLRFLRFHFSSLLHHY